MLVRTTQLVVYFLMLAGIVAAVHWSRAAAERRFATDEAQANWQSWRDDVRDQRVGGGSVERTEPRSPIPPALVLLRDHFGACLAIALILSSALYWTFAIMISGVLSPRTGGPRSPGDTSSA